MSAPSVVHQPASVRTIGRDLGPVGRLTRVLAGVAGIAAGGWLAAHDGLAAREVLAIGGYLVLIALFYLATTALLGPRVLGRIGPWTATTLFLTPVVALGVLPGVPTSLRVAVALYYGISLLVIATVRYGGCEVVGIPMVLLRRRDVIYCPLNAVDAVERPLAQLPHRATALVSAGLVVAAGLVLAARELAPDRAAGLPVDARWTAVLLVPATVVLARHAWRTGGSDDSSRSGWRTWRTGSGLGALTLVAAVLVIGATGSISLFFTAVLAVLLVGGVAAAGWRIASGE